MKQQEGRILIPEAEDYPQEFKGEVVLHVDTGLNTIQFVNGDHKDSPGDVGEQINRLLKAHDVDKQLVLVDCGDDNYYFILQDL